MKIFRAKICKQKTAIRSVVVCLGLFIASSPLRAQSSNASTSVPTKRSALDNSDPLQQFEQIDGQHFLSKIETADHVFTIPVSRSEILEAAAKSARGTSASGK